MPNFADLVTTTWESLPMATTPLQLFDKLQKLRAHIDIWSKEKMGNLDSQATNRNETLMWITKAEEIRRLTALEELLRTMLSDRLTKIEDLNEIKWRQRAKRQWIQKGDKNTKFFHFVATHQKRHNTITSLLSEDHEVTSHPQKARLLFDHLCGLVGNEGETPLLFNLQNFYAQERLTQKERDTLTQSWTAYDITQAVRS